MSNEFEGRVREGFEAVFAEAAFQALETRGDSRILPIDVARFRAIFGLSKNAARILCRSGEEIVSDCMLSLDGLTEGDIK